MLALGLFAATFVALVLGISNSVRPTEVQELMEKFPAGLRAMLGLKDGDIFDMARWVGAVHTHPVWLVAILSFPLAAGLRGIAGGIDDGTLEVVLAQPMSRSAYYLALAGVVTLGVTVCLTCSLLGGLAVRAVIELPGEIPATTLLALSASGWALALSVGGITLLASVVGAGGGRPGSWAIAIVVAMFFLRFLSNVVPTLSWLHWFTVFGYHDPRELVHEGFRAGPFLVLVSVGVACAGAGLWAFRRKQLTF